METGNLSEMSMNNPAVNTVRARILVVDDTPENLNLLTEVLEAAGYIVSTAPSGEIAREITRINPPDLILLDIMMPGMDGFETCEQIKKDAKTKEIPVLFISASGVLDSIVQGFQSGGVDYISKPFRNEELLARVETHLSINFLTKALRQKNQELEEVNERLVGEITKRQQAEDESETAQEQLSFKSANEADRWGIKGFVGKSKTFQSILGRIEQLHNFGDVNVLITGESGTGKELVARSIHAGSSSPDSPFIPVNCSAIPQELAESLFFGHQKGAFSGATRNKKGYFELANGGTLFLDEVGEMPRELQPKLLRVLEDGVINPIGSSTQIPVQLRVIAASNINFQAKMNSGQFREDLYFRLARFTVDVPPLRDRREDIPLLIEHFLNLFATEMNRPTPNLTKRAVFALNSYRYRGNIRELKNLIERAMIESGGATIDLEHLLFFDDIGDSDRDSDSAADDTETSAAIDEYNRENLLRKYEHTMRLLEAAPFKRETRAAMAKILTHLRDHAIIDNQRGRTILKQDQVKVSYLLKKMHSANLLESNGAGRWVQYRLP